ncbi:hypothetical protein C6A37_13665, partial [Desulfobacteraceae bacterium SEEP-SAG9]
MLFLKFKKRIPKKAVAVTFDDGYRDNFEMAAPILDYFGIKATFYIATATIECLTPPWYVKLRHAIWETKEKEWIA